MTDETPDSEPDETENRVTTIEYTPGRRTPDADIEALLGSPVEHSRSMGDETRYEHTSQIALTVEDILSGMGHYHDMDLVVCPECGHEASLQDAVFRDGNRGVADDGPGPVDIIAVLVECWRYRAEMYRGVGHDAEAEQVEMCADEVARHVLDEDVTLPSDPDAEADDD